jgi:membrane associated rhomboid family serine protease
LLIWLTMHPMCVQTALNALYSLAEGWVTTTCWLEKTIPPPTGIWLVLASAFPAELLLAPAAVLDAAALAAALLAGADGEVAALPAAVVLLEPLALQAVTALARPTRPTPASTPRRVASESVCGSCVTIAPIHMYAADAYGVVGPPQHPV